MARGEGGWAALSHTPLAPLGHARYRAFWLAGLVSFVGTWVHNTAARWVAATLSERPLVVSAVDTVQFLPMMLLSLAAGRYADTHDRRRILVATHVGLAVAASTMGVFAWAGWLDVPALFVLTAAIGTCSAVNGPAWQATVPRQVPDAEVPRAVALMSTGFNLARAVGPTVGAWLLLRVGASAAFFVNAASYGVMGYLFWRMPPQPPAAVASAVGPSPWAEPALRRFFLVVLAYGFAAIPALSLLPLVARDALGGDAVTYGWLVSAFGLGAAAAGLFVAHGAERFGRLPFIAGACVAAAVGMAAQAAATSAPVAIAATALCGAAWICTIVTANAGVQVLAPPASRARALAFHLTFAVGGQAAGSYMGGVLTEWIGLAAALRVEAAALVALAGGVMWWRRTS